MTELLSALTALTLGGSAAVLVLALMGRSRYQVRWRCWAWLVLCLRLIFPIPMPARSAAPIQFSAPSDTVIYQHAPAPSQAPAPAGAVQSVSPPTVQSADPVELGPDTAAPAQTFSLSLSQAAGLVWLAGAAGVLLWAALAHLRLLRHLRRWARPMQDPATVRLFHWTGDLLDLDLGHRPELLVCPGLPSPMLAGLLHPVLLLPAVLPEGEDLRFALLHELTHYRRRDLLLKGLALLASAVHWFNPLMWYMVRLVDRDLELACDEDTLRLLDIKEHAAYGRAILTAAQRPAIH